MRLCECVMSASFRILPQWNRPTIHRIQGYGASSVISVSRQNFVGPYETDRLYAVGRTGNVCKVIINTQLQRR
jgi:hypothetical protein